MCAFYRAMAFLWRVLHAHRDGGTTAEVFESVMKALEGVDAIFAASEKGKPKRPLLSAGAGKSSQVVRRGAGRAKGDGGNARSMVRVAKTATSTMEMTITTSKTATKAVRGGGRSGKVAEDVKAPVTPKPRDGWSFFMSWNMSLKFKFSVLTMHSLSFF